MIGTRILIVSELLIEAFDMRSTERLLGVATGTGNAALAETFRVERVHCDLVAVPLCIGG
jgi:hypothetical protein